ncbi:hypothetical protein ACFLY6_01785 [Candidatus Dependentiae bacterium]
MLELADPSELGEAELLGNEGLLLVELVLDEELEEDELEDEELDEVDGKLLDDNAEAVGATGLGGGAWGICISTFIGVSSLLFSEADLSFFSLFFLSAAAQFVPIIASAKSTNNATLPLLISIPSPKGFATHIVARKTLLAHCTHF